MNTLCMITNNRKAPRLLEIGTNMIIHRNMKIYGKNKTLKLLIIYSKYYKIYHAW